MSAIESIKYCCDHCGFECVTDQGDGDLGWYHSNEHVSSMLFETMDHGTDLCPNCVNELKIWLRAGPQHEEYRRALKATASVADTRHRERIALARHPAGNRKMPVFDEIIDPHGGPF